MKRRSFLKKSILTGTLLTTAPLLAPADTIRHPDIKTPKNTKGFVFTIHAKPLNSDQRITEHPGDGLTIFSSAQKESNFNPENHYKYSYDNNHLRMIAASFNRDPMVIRVVSKNTDQQWVKQLPSSILMTDTAKALYITAVHGLVQIPEQIDADNITSIELINSRTTNFKTN